MINHITRQKARIGASTNIHHVAPGSPILTPKTPCNSPCGKTILSSNADLHKVHIPKSNN